MEFVQVDVFTDTPYAGNALAVFPDAEALSARAMQAIAAEMNLSETSFVTRASGDSYDVRIFTPNGELPFAGHPTLGTAWALRRRGAISGDEVVQVSKAGETTVRLEGGQPWLSRAGTAHADLEDTDPGATRRIATALGLEADDVGLEARELGRPGRLRPAAADAGVHQLMVPLRDVATLGRCRPRADLLAAFEGIGVYCFTAVGAGRVRSRGFFPALGIAEDPGTGSAAAGLGLYLARRVGDIAFEIRQGVELGRPSRIDVRASGESVAIGGRVVEVLSGRLERLPG
ncbi:MAG TPA: PhzF family phenazine biosynthesis protein [Actinomycetota bacterium]|nr:PhzF family phenazine biosynthesis protein [Actinomycetota bacterium]